MADKNLTISQVENLFHTITKQLLGFTDLQADSFIRISWGSESGQPSWAITDNVVFLRLTPEDSPYNKQREYEYTPKTELVANEILHMTTCWRVAWTLYGPDSYFNAFKIFTSLTGPDVKIPLQQNSIFLVPDMPSPTRLPELWAAKWWERVDLYAVFNSEIKITNDRPYFLEINTTVKSDLGGEVIVNLKHDV